MRMINERLNWWLEHNNVITPCQAGFRSNYTTDDQLIRLTQKIQNGFQMKKDTIAVFVDLEKAYDKVWRQGIVIKMRDAGIHSNMYRWIKNFLRDRTIATQIEGVTSIKECLKEGLPQGSSLSCTLFTLYINDIVNTSRTRIQPSMQMTLCSGPPAQTGTVNKPTSTQACVTYGRTATCGR